MQQQPRIVYLFVVILLALSAAFLVDQLTHQKSNPDSQTATVRNERPEPVAGTLDSVPLECPMLRLETVKAPQLSPPRGSKPESPAQRGSKPRWVTEKPVMIPIQLGWVTRMILRVTGGISSIVILL